jgi:hypothetical protein
MDRRCPLLIVSTMATVVSSVATLDLARSISRATKP